MVDYEPLAPVVDYVRRSRAGRAGARRIRSEHRRRAAGWLGRPCRPGADVGAPRGGAHDLPAGVRRRTDRDAWHGRRVGAGDRGADDLGGDPVAPRGAVRLLAGAGPARAPHPGHHARHRWWVRSEGRAAARGDVPRCWPRRRCPAPSSGSRTAARTCWLRGRPGTSTPRCAWPSTTTARILAATIDHTQDVGAYPIAVAGRRRRRRGDDLPRPLPHPGHGLLPPRRCSPTPSAARRTAGRGSSSRSPGRWSSTSPPAGSASTPSSCAGGTSCGADELPYPNANGMPYDGHVAGRDLRAGPRAARLRGVPAGAGGGQDRGPLPRRGHVQLRRAHHARARATTPPRVRRSASSPRARSTSTSPAGPRATASRPPPSSSTADALGVPIDDVHTIQGDTASTPYGAGTGGSRSGSMIAGAVARDGVGAARPASRPSPPTGSRRRPTTSSSADGRAFVRGTPAVGHHAWPSMAAIAYFQTHLLPPGHARPVSRRASATRRRRCRYWANATHVCTCEVDVATGAVRLLRYIVSEDCGPMINPAVVEGQIAGGTVQGIGGALLEELAYDDDGNPITTTFMDYLLPTAAEVPDDRVRPRRHAGTGPRRLQGRRRGRGHRRPAGGDQRRRRRPVTVRRDRRRGCR